MKIILGSQSLGRKKIMAEMGYEFETMAADFDESSIRSKDPKELTLALAQAKANVLKSKISEPAILITSDTVVVCKGEILEKPINEEMAREYLRGYGDFPVEVVTSLVIANTETGKEVSGVDIAKIYFYPFLEEEIDELIEEGSVYRLAGGFTVDGEKWEKHVKRIDGTRESTIGLPKDLVKKLISEVS
ncbi:MAG: Maf family nucleotide pyrophosphatase [Patescibacteria group bacterium]